jgi:hypothetical protein
VQIVLKCGSLNLLEPSGPVQACNGIALPLPLPHSYRLLINNQFSLADNKLPENILSQEILTLNEPVSFVLYDMCSGLVLHQPCRQAHPVFKFKHVPMRQIYLIIKKKQDFLYLIFCILHFVFYFVQ